jgi:chromosome segregation ATPase
MITIYFLTYKFQVLESELEAERSNVRIQTEKLNILRKEFTMLNEKLLIAEQENEAMLSKLTSLTLQQKDLDKLLQEREFSIQNLKAEKEELINAHTELTKTVDQLAKKLDEKEQEFERVYKVSKFMTPKKTDSIIITN